MEWEEDLLQGANILTNTEAGEGRNTTSMTGQQGYQKVKGKQEKKLLRQSAPTSPEER